MTNQSSQSARARLAAGEDRNLEDGAYRRRGGRGGGGSGQGGGSGRGGAGRLRGRRAPPRAQAWGGWLVALARSSGGVVGGGGGGKDGGVASSREARVRGMEVDGFFFWFWFSRLPLRRKLGRHTPLSRWHHGACRQGVRRVQPSAGPIAGVAVVIRFPEVAELLDVCWLEITGKLQLSLLSPATTYAAYLVYSFADYTIGLERNIGMPTPMATPSAGPIAEVAAVVETVRIAALRRLLGCSGATPPPAPAQADCDVEMGLPSSESSASRPATKPQPGS
uniref:Uncharacterized protein n=1 Tax=Oryza glumipatula TaxID=40148 RepID=A0A0D9YU87_9ORYZ